ncbi:hypothetical protein GCM10027445_06260 [Amycolatopsis endophytica]
MYVHVSLPKVFAEGSGTTRRPAVPAHSTGFGHRHCTRVAGHPADGDKTGQRARQGTRNTEEVRIRPWPSSP